MYKRFEIRSQKLAAGKEILVSRQSMLRPMSVNLRSPQGRAVHPERTEKTDMAPLAQVFRDSAALVDDKRELQSGGLQSRFDPDGACSKNGQAREITY